MSNPPAQRKTLASVKKYFAPSGCPNFHSHLPRCCAIAASLDSMTSMPHYRRLPLCHLPRCRRRAIATSRDADATPSPPPSVPPPYPVRRSPVLPHARWSFSVVSPPPLVILVGKWRGIEHRAQEKHRAQLRLESLSKFLWIVRSKSHPLRRCNFEWMLS
jgi:hypothetical protein